MNLNDSPPLQWFQPQALHFGGCAGFFYVTVSLSILAYVLHMESVLGILLVIMKLRIQNKGPGDFPGSQKLAKYFRGTTQT